MKKWISLLLCLVLCLGLAIPALAAADSGKPTVTAALDPEELTYDGTNDQTVTLTVSFSEAVEIYSLHLETDLPKGWTLTGVKSASSGITLEKDKHYSLDTGIVSWFDSKNTTVTDLATLTVTVPAKTAAGDYKLGVREIQLATAGENDDDNWMEGGSAYATLTILPNQEKTPDYVIAMNGAEDYLASRVTNPAVGSTFGEWAVFALNRGGVAKPGWNDTYLENLKKYVDGCKGVLAERNYTEYSRVILALTSMGVDASAFETDKGTYDLVKPLLDKQADGAYQAEWQGNNGTAFALLAVDSHDYLDNAEGKALRAGLIASLMKNQQANGAWPISGDDAGGLPDGFGDYDVTAAAIYALAPYYLDSSKLSALGGSVTHAQVKNMVDDALAFLSKSQDGNGGFGSVEADSWVVIALSSLKRDADTDPDFVKNGNSLLADMLRYRDEKTGGFRHLMSGGVDEMATEEAAYGLVAYDRFVNKKNTLYDMSDVRFAQSQEDSNEALVTVTFHLQGGKADGITDSDRVTYTKSDDGRALPKPTRDNYSFVGWFDKADGGTEYKSVSAGLPADLYAQWKSSGSGGGGGSGSSDDEGKIKVSFRLIGARKADKDVDLGKEEYMPDYVTWIATTTYNMEEGSTVYDLWVKATGDAGIRSVGAEQNYVKTVYAPGDEYALSEFTNGKRSGWMYTINGRHPGFGLKEQELHDGDRVIWHYVNDYSYEVADWFEDDSRWPSLGDGRYYTRWLKAPDRVGGYGGGLGEGAQAGGGGDSGSSGSSEIAPTYDGDTVWIKADVDRSEGGAVYAADATLDKKTVAEGLEKAEDKSSLKLWVDMEDSNRLVLRVETEAMKEIADAGAGLRLGCGKGVIKLDADAVALLAESGREVRMVVSYDDWNKKTTVSVRPYPPTEEDPDVRIRIELPVTKEGQALSVVNGDGTTTPIKKSAIIGDRVYAEVPSGTTVTITESRHYWDDVKDKDWFADAVSFVVSHELMNGVDRYEFAPNDPMTRAMLVTVLYRLEDEPEFTGGLDSFGDVDVKSWYAEAVAWASETGLVNGTENGFEPGANITREQIATILYRYAKYTGLVGEDTAAPADMSAFSDGEKVSSWAQEAMAWAVEVGLFKGDDTGSLNPQGNATRAEVATLLERLIKLIVVS